MKTVLLYRHEDRENDPRLIEVSGDSAGGELWLLYPERKLLEKTDSFEASKAALPDGFVLDECTFSPPCPKCTVPSPMSPATGMYECRECDTTF